MDQLAYLLAVTEEQAIFLLCAVLFAGIVRGFTGFALSALIMATGALILAPAELIPVCLMLEGVATLIMARGNVGTADMPMVKWLTIGVVIGSPLGVWLTSVLPVDQSRLIALALILVLSAGQLFGLRLPSLTGPRTISVGILSGAATGLASVGGMVVANFAMSLRAPAPVIRATLVMYLAFGMAIGLISLFAFDLLTETALWRGAILTPPAIIGVLIGARLFRPSVQHIYRPLCLSLLTGLAGFGLIRMAF
ncbi:MAG: TSUP family transporter [Pikeienuella sp.]